VTSDPDFSRSQHFLKSNIGKTASLKDNVTIAQEATIPNIWNSILSLQCDLDWPLNASVARVCHHQLSFLLNWSKRSWSHYKRTQIWTNVNKYWWTGISLKYGSLKASGRRNILEVYSCVMQAHAGETLSLLLTHCSVIFVNENENENYQKRKNNDSVNEN